MVENSSEIGPVKVVQPPVIVKEQTSTNRNVTAASEQKPQMEQEMKSLSEGTTGGAMGPKSEPSEKNQQDMMGKMKLFLQKTGVSFEQLQPELQEKIKTMQTNNPAEFDKQFKEILEEIPKDPVFPKDQTEKLAEFQTAIHEGTISPSMIFGLLEDQIKSNENVSGSEREGALQDLNEIKKELEQPKEMKPPTIKEKAVKIAKVAGIGGIALLLMNLWKGFKESMGGEGAGRAGGGMMPFPMG